MPNEFDNFRELMAWSQDMDQYMTDGARITLPDTIQVGEMMAETDQGKRLTKLADKINEIIEALTVRQGLVSPALPGSMDLVAPLELLEERVHGLDYISAGGDLVAEKMGHTVSLTLNRRRIIEEAVASLSPVEFGSPKQEFTSGDTIELYLCDENGVYKNGSNKTNPETGEIEESKPTGETPTAKAFVGPNRQVVGQTYLTTDILTWMRFPKPTETGAVVGVLVGVMSGLPLGQGPYKYLEVAEDMSVAWDYARMS